MKIQKITFIRLTLFFILILFWLTLLLFQLRIVNIFDAYFMKFPGPWIVFGVMLSAPFFLFFCNRRLPKPLKYAIQSISILFFLAFIVYIGIPLLLHKLEPVTPKNPRTPKIVIPQTGIPVFPGAEGFGTRTQAGRGGKIIHVTSLADSGPGTLREALNVPGPRIIVFQVGGIIELNDHLYINRPFVTLAGQTAPGGGICLKNAGIVITTHDVLIQYLRIRPGNEGPIDADNNDAVAILGQHGDIEGACRVVLDHISASWSEDETISTWYGAHDITISWSIVSEALNRSRHRKRTHSAGLLVGDSSCHVSMHHNLLVHNDFRNPLIIEGGTHDFINNIIYNWGVLPAEIIDFYSNSFLNFIGNYYIAGPSTESGNHEIVIGQESGVPRIYAEGNLGPYRHDSPMDDWRSVGYGYGTRETAPETYRSITRFFTPPITELSAEEAYEIVLHKAGAIYPQRDAIDSRIVNDVRNKTGHIIDDPSEVGGYSTLASGTPPLDTDLDGMPSTWEELVGLDPDDPSDSSQDRDNDGYTNIEEYLFLLCGGRE